MDEFLLSKKDKDATKTWKESRFRSPNCSSSWHDLPDPHRWSSETIASTATCRSIIHSTPNSTFINLITNFSKKRILTRKSHSAPSLVTDTRESSPNFNDRLNSWSTPSVVRQAFAGVLLYIAIGVSVYLLKSDDFKGHTTFRLVDALYFSVVTLCTIGYGDIVPAATFTKLFTCAFILVGFGFIDILLNGLVVYVLDRQEAILLSTMDHNWRNPLFQTYVMDMKKGRMRIRMKVGLALVVVVACIAVGMLVVHVLEGLNWLDSFYLSVTSVTTVGYGDYTFKTTTGRLFAIIWLLVSTLAVARAFLYLTELRMDKRNRKVAKWVLQKKMTIGDLVAADLDNDGSIRYEQ